MVAVIFEVFPKSPAAEALRSPADGEGRGALFAGDQPRPCMDYWWVSFIIVSAG